MESSGQNEQTVVIKPVRKRTPKEQKRLDRLQRATPNLRPLLDKIQGHPAILLQYFDNDLHRASYSKALTRLEVKHVTRNILQALAFLHGMRYDHTG